MDIFRIDKSMAAAVAPLAADFRAVLNSLRGIDFRPEDRSGEEEILEFLQKGYPVFAAVDEGAPAGYVVCRIEEPCLWVEHIYVRPEHRRRGIATKLFEKAEALARSMGEDTVFNYVHPNNQDMILFLRSKGYTVLNMIEIRKPYKEERLTATIPVAGNLFDY